MPSLLAIVADSIGISTSGIVKHLRRFVEITRASPIRSTLFHHPHSKVISSIRLYIHSADRITGLAATPSAFSSSTTAPAPRKDAGRRTLSWSSPEVACVAGVEDLDRLAGDQAARAWQRGGTRCRRARHARRLRRSRLGRSDRRGALAAGVGGEQSRAAARPSPAPATLRRPPWRDPAASRWQHDGGLSGDAVEHRSLPRGAGAVGHRHGGESPRGSGRRGSRFRRALPPRPRTTPRSRPLARSPSRRRFR